MKEKVQISKGGQTTVKASSMGMAAGTLVVIVLSQIGIDIGAESASVGVTACGTIAGYFLK